MVIKFGGFAPNGYTVCTLYVYVMKLLTLVANLVENKVMSFIIQEITLLA